MLVYNDELVFVYNTDSQNLNFISDNSVHLVVTSPPYNTGMPYDNHNDEMIKSDYLEMLHNVFAECYRVMKKGAKICVNVPSCLAQTRFSKIAFLSVAVHDILEKIGFIPYGWIYWDKIINTNKKLTSWGSWKSPSCPAIRDAGDEYIIIMAKESFKIDIPDGAIIDITKDEFILFSFNRWEILPKHSEVHPAVFPEEIPYRCIKLFTWQGATVLDPFAGSGTTGIAGKKTKRKTILVEKSKKYCDLIKKRISQCFLF